MTDANDGRDHTTDHPARRWLGRLAKAALVAAIFALPAAGALLDFVGAYVDGTPEVPDGLDGASGVAISPDGRHVYATGHEDDALVVFVRDATAETLAFVEVLIDQVGGVFGLDGASSVTVSEDGRHVYVTGGLSDAVAVFARDASLDALAFAGAQVDGSGGVSGLGGARAVAVDPFRDRVYVAGAADDSLVIFDRDPVGHELTYVATIEDGKRGVDGLAGAAALLLTPDGEHLYVAGRDDDAIAVFAFRSGEPKLVQVARAGADEKRGLDGPVALALSADGRFLYAGIVGTGSVAIFRRAPGSGDLTFLGSAFEIDRLDLQGADALAASPDGKHLLVASRALDLIALMRQDAVFSDGFESGDVSQWSGSAP